MSPGALAAATEAVALMASRGRNDRGGGELRLALDLAAVPDDELVRRFVSSGDPEPFAALVERHHARLQRLAAATLGRSHAAAAEEVVQEALLVAYRTLGRLRDPKRAAAWLSSITYRRAVDHLRTPRVRRAHVGDDHLLDRAGDDSERPDARASMSERRRHLEHAIGQLPPPQPTVLRLHYWLGSSIDEIATLLDVRPGTVKSYLFRARRRLHDLLEPEAVADDE